MRISSLSNRHVRLSLSDFAVDPVELGMKLTGEGIIVQRKGDKTQTGRLIQKSSLTMALGFDGATTWERATDALISSLGGVQQVERLLAHVDAKDQHIHFQLPVRGSPQQDTTI